MTDSKRRRSPLYLLVFFLPVVFISLIAGVVNIGSWQHMRADFRETNEQQAREIRDMSAAIGFDQEIADIQRLVLSTQEGASAGRLTEADVYLVHAEVVNRLAALADDLPAIERISGSAGEFSAVSKEFESFRNAIIQATDLAALDPPGAMRQAFLASRHYIALSSRTGHMVQQVVEASARRADDQYSVFTAHAARIIVIGALLVVSLLIVWFFITHWLSRQVASVTETLQALAGGDASPDRLKEIERISMSPRNILRDIARATLAFHESVVARKSGEEALSRERKLLQVLIDGSPDPIWLKDAEGVYLIGNPRIASIIGVPAKDLVGGTDFDFFPRDVAEFFRAKDRAVMASGRSATNQEWLTSATDGYRGLFETVKTPVYSSNGSLLGVLGMARDISLLANTQHELDQRVKELSCLYDIFEVTEREDLEEAAVLQAVVERLPRAMRFPELAVACISGAGAPIGNPAVFDAPEHLSVDLPGNSDSPLRLGVAYLGALPEEVPERFLKEEIALLDAVALRISGSLKKRHKLEVERDNQSLMTAIIEESPFAIELIDAETLKFVKSNSAACGMLGYTREEIFEITLDDVQAVYTPAELRRYVRQTIEQGSVRFENVRRRKDGRLINISVDIKVIEQHGRKYMLVIWSDITAQKLAAAEIRMLSSAVDQSQNTVLITDLDVRTVYVNEAFIRNTGYRREEIIGQNPRLLKSGKTPEATYRAMWAALTSGKPWRGEFINRSKDGVERVESVNIAPLRGEDGKLCNYVAVMEDITEKRRTTQELEAYRERLEQLVQSRTAELANAMAEQQALFDSATVGIVLMRDRVILRCNRRMDEMFGYGFGEQIGQPTRIWYGDDVAYDAVGRSLAANIPFGRTHTAEQEVVRKDGSRFWVRMSGRAIDPDDLAKGMVGVIEDITDEHAAAEALRLANEEQQAIFDTASSGIALIVERQLVRCNRKLHELFGWDEGEMVGKRTAIWYADEAANYAGGEPVYEQIWRGVTHSREQELVRKDGSRFWARLTGKAVDLEHRDKGTVWVIDDITAERDALLSMGEARKLAEEAARTKADFLANMSHEIRTPMNAVIGMTHLALKTDLSRQQRDYLTKIQSSSHHLLGIINDILDFSKIEAGKMVLEHIEFDLESVLRNVSSLIGDKAASKGLELVIDLAPDVPLKLVGDPLRVGQVLVNYANNAVKFTDAGTIGIHGSVQQVAGEEVVLHFSVTDTGIGIEKENLGRLFKSFEQADTSTTRKYGGTGLGLSICQQLASLMGGEVGVVSEFGKGSTFWFTARFGVSEQQPRVLLPKPDLRGRRVLVVDDNEQARLLLRDMLTSMSFQVSLCASGEEAIAEIVRTNAAGKPFQTVILDWQMPGMDGLETARRMRDLLPSGTPNLLMATAFGRDEVIQSAPAAGIYEILIKPITPSLLFETMMMALGENPSETDKLQTKALPGTDLSRIAGARILLVEDNELNQEVAVALLTDAGFTVDVANDGAIAVDRLKRDDAAYDAVLMDMQMPNMDGLTATREIRRIERFKDLPIIAMTANAMEEDRRRCLAAGMNDHVVKPIDPDQLWTALLRWIPARHEAGAGTASAAMAAATAGGRDRMHGETAQGPQNDQIDQAVGLRNAMGREDLYQRILHKFADGHRGFRERLWAAIDGEDWETAERLTHTLKGTAAQVGAIALGDEARQVEGAIRRREAKMLLHPLVDALSSQLEQIIEGIRPEARREMHHAMPAHVDQEAAKAVLQSLVEHLESDDFSCSELIAANEPLLEAVLGEHFASFAAKADDFDFSGALEVLKSSAGIAL